jgi:hypothetical protein
MHSQDKNNETFREIKRNFSVNIISTENCESTVEPGQVNPPFFSSLVPLQKKRSHTYSTNEELYSEKLKALGKIKELQKAASELNKRLSLQDVEQLALGDDEFIKKTGEKLMIAKRKRGRGCDCNQSCFLF